MTSPLLMDGAACGRHPDPDLWFRNSPIDREAARHICRACPVLAACREWGISVTSTTNATGVLGGLTGLERLAERRRRRQAGPARPSAAETRDAALALVTGTPGLNRNAIIGQLAGHNQHTVQQAMRDLEAAGQVTVVIRGSSRLHYPAGPPSPRQRALALVTGRPGITQTAIRAALGCSYKEVRVVLDDLEAAGLVTISDGPHGALLHYPAGSDYPARPRTPARRWSRPVVPPRARTPADVLAIVTGQPGMTQGAVRLRAGRSVCWTRKMLDQLEAAGQITVTTGRTRAGQPTRLHYPAAVRAQVA